MTLTALCLSVSETRASHMMGGQITLAPAGGLTYTLTYTAYRDMVGIPIATTAMITFFDSTSGVSFTRNFSYDSSNVVVLVPGVEQYTYSDTVTFPNAGDWYISYEECCRNFAILNMTNAGSESHHFYTKVSIDSVNATPEFLNPPIVLAQEGFPFYYNPLPFDVNGDSIAWSLSVPLSSLGYPVAGYTLPSSDSLVPFNMDPITGEITFLPNLAGNFQVSVRVNEYRNGVQIGEISRDMQIIVVPCANNPVSIILNSNINPVGNKTYQVPPGSSLNMNVNIYDQDAQAISVTATGEPFMLASNPAIANIVNGTGSASFTFNWTPDLSQVRENPYLIGFRVSETYSTYVFQSDVTIALRVGNAATGIQQLAAEHHLAITPNPASTTVDVQFMASSTKAVAINIISQDGKLVKSAQQELLSTGVQVIRMNINDLAKGIYLLNVIQNGQQLGVDRLVVVD